MTVLTIRRPRHLGIVAVLAAIIAGMAPARAPADIDPARKTANEVYRAL